MGTVELTADLSLGTELQQPEGPARAGGRLPGRVAPPHAGTVALGTPRAREEGRIKVPQAPFMYTKLYNLIFMSYGADGLLRRHF